MKKEDKIRYFILTLFLVLFTIFSLRHFVLGGAAAAAIDALCPFGGFETLLTFIVTGGFVPRILMSSLVLGIGVLLTVILFKKGFCGYICPFGTVQELLGKITKNKIKLNAKLDKNARYIKYVILLLILGGTAYTGTLVFRSYDPFMTFFHFGKGILWDYSVDEFSEHIVAFIITIGVLIGSVFIDRFFCRYLCPLGATMNIFAWFGLTKIKRDKHTCIDCKLCDKKCPMDVKISTVDTIKDVECINCNQCVSVCPKDSLSINIFKKHESITTYVILLLIIFLGVIGGAKAVGIWQSVPITTIEDESGSINPDLIKGWMTLEEVAESSGINIQHFIEDFNLNNIDPKTPLKDLNNFNTHIETEQIREYIKNFVHGSHHVEEKATCPWGLKNDPYPGRCGLYEDKNNDRICDLSQ